MEQVTLVSTQSPSRSCETQHTYLHSVAVPETVCLTENAGVVLVLLKRVFTQ